MTETNPIRALFDDDYFKKQVADALPKICSPERFLRISLTAMMRTPHLAECDEASFIQCMLMLSQYGLEPDGRNAHLIPYYNSNRKLYECTMQIDYKGFVELAMRSGQVATIHADLVRDADEFEYDIGVITRHRPNFRKPRGEWYAVYCLVTFKDGSKKSDVMGRDEVLAIRNRSQSWKALEAKRISTCPWLTDEGEMSKKTVFKRLSKWISLSPEFRDAVQRDNEFEGADDHHTTGLPDNREEQAANKIILPTEIVQPEKITIPATGTKTEPDREAEEPGSNQPTETVWPNPIENFLGAVRRTKSEMSLLSVKQGWLSIKADYPADMVAEVDAIFERRMKEVTPVGPKTN